MLIDTKRRIKHTFHSGSQCTKCSVTQVFTRSKVENVAGPEVRRQKGWLIESSKTKRVAAPSYGSTRKAGEKRANYKRGKRKKGKLRPLSDP